jgi:hypothetical protein
MGQPHRLRLPEKKPACQLFNFIQDPLERRDVADEERARHASMVSQYKKWFKEVTTSYEDLTNYLPSGTNPKSLGSMKITRSGGDF